MIDAANRKALLAKIRKCLALGKSSNEAEAAAALAKARELMDAYGLTAQDVELSEISDELAKGNRSQTPPMWESRLARVVQRALGVQAVLGSRPGEWHFIGAGAAPQVAVYAFTVLFRQLKAARAEYTRTRLKRCGLARKRQRADVFSEAWATAVFVQVHRLMPEPPKNEAIGKYLATRFGQLSTVEARTASIKGARTDQDYWAGHDQGRKVELHNAVGGNAGKMELLA